MSSAVSSSAETVRISSLSWPTRQATACPGSRLAELMLAAGAKVQAIQLNPTVAPQRAILEDGFVPTSGEHELTHSEKTYHLQRAERFWDGSVRIYFVVRGHWDMAEHVERDPKTQLAHAHGRTWGQRKGVLRRNRSTCHRSVSRKSGHGREACPAPHP